MYTATLLHWSLPLCLMHYTLYSLAYTLLACMYIDARPDVRASADVYKWTLELKKVTFRTIN